ncbi:hypothetical protein I4U23_017033 [Adineta vaga]|nr:hypothetical protein I4U23_017033 [Adineta vaga]
MASNIKSTQSAAQVSNEAYRRGRINIQKVQNVVFIWLDSTIDGNNKDCQIIMAQLRRVVGDVNTYTDGEQCIQYIETIQDRKACMIMSGSLGEHLAPRIHDLTQVDSIFIFCGNKKHHEQWAKEWPKIKGVFTEIKPICDALKQAVQQCEQNAMSISFVKDSKNLDQLHPTFIKKREISLGFAKNNANNPDLVGILFMMQIDPKQSRVPFASISGISDFSEEDEILFSMHMSLTLTSDNDKQLDAVTERIRKDSFPHANGWPRLGLVLIKMGQNEKAEEIYEILLDQEVKESVDDRKIVGVVGVLNYTNYISKRLQTFIEMHWLIIDDKKT